MKLDYRFFAPAMVLVAVFAIGSRQAAAVERFDCIADPAMLIELGSPVSGLLTAVTAERGQQVTEGDVIATIEASVEAASVEVGRALVENRTAISIQEERAALARSRLERASRLLRTNVVAQQQIDELTSEVRVIEQELAHERANLRLAELDLARAESALALRTLRSPITGIVVSRDLGPGEYIHQEAHVVTLARLDPLHVEVFLPVELYGRVATGQTGFVEPQAPIGGRYEAQVTVVDQVFDAASGTFGVRLSLPNPELLLPAGLRCEVSFELAEPSEAVR